MLFNHDSPEGASSLSTEHSRAQSTHSGNITDRTLRGGELIDWRHGGVPDVIGAALCLSHTLRDAEDNCLDGHQKTHIPVLPGPPA